MKKPASSSKPFPSDYSDLVPWHERLGDFDRSAITNVCHYRPLVAELEAKPKDRADRGRVAEEVPVLVWPNEIPPELAGQEAPFEYKTTRAACKVHGRWVRTSLDAGRPTDKGVAIQSRVVV